MNRRSRVVWDDDFVRYDFGDGHHVACHFAAPPGEERTTPLTETDMPFIPSPVPPPGG